MSSGSISVRNNALITEQKYNVSRKTIFSKTLKENHSSQVRTHFFFELIPTKSIPQFLSMCGTLDTNIRSNENSEKKQIPSCQGGK